MGDEAGKPLRVVVWSTGTVGRHAIAGIDRHPGLDLIGVWVSDPAKIGRDAGELAGLGRSLGVIATGDRDALVALRPDAVLHAAMTDDRPFEAIDDLTALIRDGVNVVSSGPVMLQWPWQILPAPGLALAPGGRRVLPGGRLRRARAALRPGAPG